MAFSFKAVVPLEKERAANLMAIHLELTLVAQTRLVAKAKLLALLMPYWQALGFRHPFLLESYHLPGPKLTCRDFLHQAEVV